MKAWVKIEREEKSKIKRAERDRGSEDQRERVSLLFSVVSLTPSSLRQTWKKIVVLCTPNWLLFCKEPDDCHLPQLFFPSSSKIQQDIMLKFRVRCVTVCISTGSLFAYTVCLFTLFPESFSADSNVSLPMLRVSTLVVFYQWLNCLSPLLSLTLSFPAVTMSERWPVNTRCQASPPKTTASLS